jgi:P27 family predicted phage terminase small subunit
LSRPISENEMMLHGYNEATIKRVNAKKLEPNGEIEAGRPDAPAQLSDAEKSVWDSVVVLLEHRRALTPGDATALMLYCQVFVELRAERALLDREGRVETVSKLDRLGREILIRATNPRVRIVRDLERQLFMIVKELGLTPLRRHNVRATKEKNPLSTAEKVLRDAKNLFAKETN